MIPGVHRCVDCGAGVSAYNRTPRCRICRLKHAARVESAKAVEARRVARKGEAYVEPQGARMTPLARKSAEMNAAYARERSAARPSSLPMRRPPRPTLLSGLRSLLAMLLGARH